MKHILIVEDDKNLAGFMVDLLEMEGYSVDTASNGREGLARITQIPPDLVICDLMMPVLDGEGFCLAMQADRRYKTIPIVLMSARREPSLSANCRYSAFLAKPFEIDLLLDVTTGIVGPPE